MNNSKREKVIKVSYLPVAEQDVMKMMSNDMYGTLLMIKRICKENGLDPYNFLHFNIAIDMIKHQVTWN
jgi:hypothetical protein